MIFGKYFILISTLLKIIKLTCVYLMKFISEWPPFSKKEFRDAIKNAVVYPH